MGLPLSFPEAKIARKLPPTGECLTIENLCERAGIQCRVTGPPAQRRIFLAQNIMPFAVRLPGDFSDVWIGLPHHLTPKRRAFLALGFLAYGDIFDYAARECLRGLPEAQPASVGRPKKATALTNAERQKRWRTKQTDLST